jgi:hypothetical protein
MNEPFKFYALNEKGIYAVDAITQGFDLLLKGLYNIIETQNNTGAREMALMRTKLEEACFFAKRAVSIDPVYQKFEEN